MEGAAPSFLQSQIVAWVATTLPNRAAVPCLDRVRSGAELLGVL